MRWMHNNTGFLKTLSTPVSSLPAMVLIDGPGKGPRVLSDKFDTVSKLVSTAINQLGLDPDILPSVRLAAEEGLLN